MSDYLDYNGTITLSAANLGFVDGIATAYNNAHRRIVVQVGAKNANDTIVTKSSGALENADLGDNKNKVIVADIRAETAN